MAFYDGKGNFIDLEAKLPSRLNGADVVIFGDSNIYYSAGNTLGDIGSFYYQLAKEFSINTWTNKGENGQNSSQAVLRLKAWATEEVIARYNRESTIILFWYGTNDKLEWWTGATCPNAIAEISAFMVANFPKAFYAWIIPPETDWSKWTGLTEPDDRNMAEKVPYLIQYLEKNHIPYLDMYHQSGITAEMLSDGVHLGGGGEDYSTDAVYRAYRVLREYLMNK